ncbi:Aegerolysin family protein [Penicillium robsamsonii]|uniref:Aegerolysin family protein n=1 Tax=Penicillium robsamsonii TaxID=1792511 RepID=UPI0025494CE1|nr:Aegerolysin family protein [Penicillium robsamsonii]KAJ5834401.1 Aegerolysin family protein [Penicillium robsamsonii]
MVYSQWVVIKISNLCRGTISIANAKVDYGKFHKIEDKDAELSPEDINSIVLKPNDEANVCACGRANIHYGTEGSFELFDGADKVCRIYFDDPYNSSINNFQIFEKNSRYAIDVSSWSREGALGNVSVEVLKK